MMSFWRSLHHWDFGAFNATNDKTYDEENLRWGSGLPKCPRPNCRLIPRLRKATVVFLLIDLMVVGLLLQSFAPLISLLRRNEELFGSRVALPAPYRPDARHQMTSSGQIPRILHQTAATETIPNKWIESQQSCIEAYSDFEYKLWTDESARDFLSIEYPWFMDTWDAYAFPIQRADALRYFVLYHFGGVYLDMDTWCNQSFPLHEIGLNTSTHYALFKSTVPTGVTNDFMITSARHPIYAKAIAKLPIFYAITHLWARWQPYCAIMISAGPMFLTLVIKEYLLEQPSLPSPLVGVINATELAPYITDMESGSWHRTDAQVLMWIGKRRWSWFFIGAVGLAAGLSIFHRLLTIMLDRVLRKVDFDSCNPKVAKES
ncbi:uncharacterized protein N7446_003207 [Penicillium canescens]|uniref:Mannosyl phosphorylinositol ceramide synthase SUR1 n=1 Tax=Penicillium canescens TaxID=5083 RepID=A0AAD6IG37_PENCN|nr:uncharacterized protein N7446_003207 [Penicillium canescens]KAJ6045006.1 hypothetical protein N7460_006361 [Penicillium canescens]KAJ6056476.1 hypothetical protein N7444_005574 [Penicillium canescens]KAJ6075430.1 hypothetical protein N7446_003207 [Penicillium canescens]